MLEDKIFFTNNETYTTENISEVVETMKIDLIRHNTNQPRKHFKESSLQVLSEDIKLNGFRQPIKVKRSTNGFFEIYDGDNKFIAAKMAGLLEVPVIIVKLSVEEEELLSVFESMNTKKMNFIEEAEIYSELMSKYDITQEVLARKFGMSQSTIANKVRILKLSPIVKKILKDNSLTERHARALLKLVDEQLQLKVLKTVTEKKMNVKKTEDLVIKVLNKYSDKAKSKSSAIIYGSKEVKTFVINLKDSLKVLKDSGKAARAAQFDKGEFLEFIIRIPKESNELSEKKNNIDCD